MWGVAGMRLYIPEPHGSIVLQECGLSRQQASQLIFRSTLLLATKVQRVAAPSSGDEVQVLAYPGHFNLPEAQRRVVTVKNFETQIGGLERQHLQGPVARRPPRPLVD